MGGDPVESFQAPPASEFLVSETGRISSDPAGLPQERLQGESSQWASPQEGTAGAGAHLASLGGTAGGVSQQALPQGRDCRVRIS